MGHQHLSKIGFGIIRTGRNVHDGNSDFSKNIIDEFVADNAFCFFVRFVIQLDSTFDSKILGANYEVDMSAINSVS